MDLSKRCVDVADVFQDLGGYGGVKDLIRKGKLCRVGLAEFNPR